jgi:hypothetical protein
MEALTTTGILGHGIAVKTVETVNTKLTIETPSTARHKFNKTSNTNVIFFDFQYYNNETRSKCTGLT